MTYEPATRKGTFIFIGFTGHSGGGKTHSSLLLARGLVGPHGKIAVLDTENGRASQKSHLTPFKTDILRPPFTPARFLEKVKEAAADGFNCLIIDSVSHEWEGEGGVLEMADNEKYANGSPMGGVAKWARPKSEHKKFMNEVMQSRMHIILCIRAKDKTVQTKGQDGRVEIVSVGITPIQDIRTIFELDISLIMDVKTKIPEVCKLPDDLMGVFPAGQRITEEDGKKIAEWIEDGESVDEDLTRLEQTARDVASFGREKMLQYWGSLSKKDQKSLKPIQADLNSIADTADAAATPPEPEDSDENILDDDFTKEKEILDKGGDPVNPLS